jgi:predicted nucleic acid-binding Zn ribbon protein
MYQTNDLDLAISYVNTGKKKEAREILRNILSIDNRNEKAWMIFAEAAEKRKDELECLKNVLNINPNNEVAKQKLFLLTTPVGEKDTQSQLQIKQRICPFCKEAVKNDAIVCSHCGRNISTINQRIANYFRAFIRNLVILIILMVILYIIGGPFMGLVFKTYWLLLGPIGVLILIVSALPFRR